METTVSEKRIHQHLEKIVGDRYPFSSESKLSAVEQYLLEEFESYGLKVEKNFFEFESKTFTNLIAELPGEKSSVFLIGAHFDAVENCPGADDNASGIAVLLESARILSQEKFFHSIRFASFNLEEFGMIGSSHYVKKIEQEKQKLIGMISLEMVGYTNSRPGSQQYPPGMPSRYPNTGNFIGLVSNGNSKPLLKTVAQKMREIPSLPVEELIIPFNGWSLPAARLSDHSPFWDAGYPALLVTDTSFFRNPHYHLPSDTLDTLNLEFMRRVTAGIVQTYRALASQ